MNNLAKLVIGIFLFQFASCAISKPATPAQIELIRKAMEGQLKDSYSAKFKDVRFGSGSSSNVICGEVNAKNSYGAYTGYVAFMAMYLISDSPSVILLQIDDDVGGGASIVCKRLGI